MKLEEIMKDEDSLFEGLLEDCNNKDKGIDGGVLSL